MKISKTKHYERDYRNKIVGKNKKKEQVTLRKIEDLILDSDNLKCLLANPLKILYGIEKKKGDLKEIYTARINSKIRLYMKPIGDYPYNEIEISEIEFIKIDDRHYGDG